MITIKNTQRTATINIAYITRDIEHLLHITGYTDFDIGVWITTDRTIRMYNKKYRKKNTATTILSFPFHPSHTPGKRIHTRSKDEQNLGDIIISVESVIKDAPKWNQTFEQRLRELIIHGFCHLIGYTHTDDLEQKKMLRKEQQLLNTLSQKNLLSLGTK
jgi:probable rRNA maturation factor